jgi:hypothetical protein
VAEVVDADIEVDAGRVDGGQPDAGAEGVAGDRGPSRVANSRSSGPRRRVLVSLRRMAAVAVVAFGSDGPVTWVSLVPPVAGGFTRCA